jgi:hypothetical protein
VFQLFLVILLAQFTADFIFQKTVVISLKKTQLHKGLVIHVTNHLIVTVLAVLLYIAMSEHTSIAFLGKALVAIILIAILHYLIDWLKEILGRRYRTTVFSAGFYILDQMMHIFSIVVVLNALGLISYTLNQFKDDSMAFIFGEMAFSDPSKLLMLMIILIAATQGSGYFLGIVLRDLGPNAALNKGTYSIVDEKTEIKTLFNEKGEEVNEITTTKTEQFYKDSSKQIGRYIGMIERILIIIFIVQGIPHGLTFLIAVKSLTRFKQFENKQFAEYYLIGSLSSALIAIILGYAVLCVI